VLVLTIAMFWAVDNTGFGNKLSMVFSMQEQGSMHTTPPQAEQKSSTGTEQIAPQAGHPHEEVSIGTMLKSLLYYIIILAWTVTAVFNLEKMLRYLSKKRKPGILISGNRI